MEQAEHQQSACSGGFALCWASTVLPGAAELLCSASQGLDIQMHRQNNRGLQLFSDSFAYLLLSDSQWEWSLGKQVYFTRKGDSSSSPRTSMVLLHAWLSQASVMQEETFLTANNPSSSSTLDISTFLHLILFLPFFFPQTKHSHVISCSSIVLMDVLPTKTLGFRWLILCDCNGL